MRFASLRSRAIAASSLAVHVAAGLLATVAHDHGGADPCCGPSVREAAIVAASDGSLRGVPTSPGRPLAERLSSCRHHACSHTRLTVEQGGAEDRQNPARLRLSQGADLKARCLACEFLASSIAILGWSPLTGEATPNRPLPNAAGPQRVGGFTGSALARGPPA
jgi:hypothetical protein